jgi:hypothetical protein
VGTVRGAIDGSEAVILFAGEKEGNGVGLNEKFSIAGLSADVIETNP